MELILSPYVPTESDLQDEAYCASFMTFQFLRTVSRSVRTVRSNPRSLHINKSRISIDISKIYGGTIWHLSESAV